MKNKNILFLLHQEWFDIFKPLVHELQSNSNNINIHFNEKNVYTKNLKFLKNNKIELVSFKDISTPITKVLKKIDSKNSISQFISEKILLCEFYYYYKITKNYLQYNNITIIYLHTDISWRLEVAITKAAKDLSITVVVPSSILMEPDIANIRNNENFYINKQNSWYQSKTFNKFKSPKYGVQTYENHFRYKAYILNFLYKIDSLSTAPFVFGGSPNTTHLYVCNKYSKEIAIKNGVKASKITITGDISYDILYESYRNKDIIKKSIIKNQDRNKKIVIFGVPQLYEHGYTSKEVAVRDIENIIRNVIENDNILLFLSLHPMMEKKNYIYLEKKYHCFILNKPLVKVLPIADLYIAAVSNTLNWSILCNINTIAFDFYNWDMQLANTLRSIEFVKKREQMKNSIQKMLYKKVDFSIDNELISKEIIFDGYSMKRNVNYNGEKMNESTKKNLDRKSNYVDKVQLLNNIPLFSWIDISLTELCNRKCVFCPRADDAVYPNQKLHMSKELLSKMANELEDLKYEGSIVFAGFGEPLLYPDLIEVIPYFKDIRIEIVTNGDLLTVKFIKDLYASGVDFICVSMYDGVEQIDKFDTMFSKAEIDKDRYLLRDRWHTDEDDYGLKLTNRAGVVNIGKQDAIDVSKPCYYPHYSMTIDWNGDVLLCVQDWNKKVKLGNTYPQTLLEVWNSKLINKYRKTLGNCNRNLNPCQNCNADGTLHGFNHIKYWESEK